MSSVLSLFQDIEAIDESLKNEELVNNSGSNYVNASGIFKGTIERCFATETKKGGVQIDLHIGGENSYNTTLFPVIKNKDGKKVTTYEVKGKQQSLADYKMLKQIIFVATGKGQEIQDLNLKEEEITYKQYGKDVTVTAGTLVDLIGKEIQFGIRLEEQYNYEDGQVDKTSLKTDKDGNIYYDKKLYSVYSKLGKTPIELVKKEEATQIEKDREFLTGPKGIKRVKLEIAEIEDIEEVSDIDDEIDF